MTVRSPLAIAIVVLFALLGGCAQDSAPPSSRSVPGQGDPAAANPDDGGGKQKQDAQRSAPATTREQFMPILERAYGRVSWPSSYTMTPDKLWAFMSAGARDTVYVESDAASMVTIWNACAWTFQLIDDTKAGRPVSRDIDSLTALSTGEIQDIVGRILSDAKLGELGTARQFITANDCEKGFRH